MIPALFTALVLALCLSYPAPSAGANQSRAFRGD